MNVASTFIVFYEYEGAFSLFLKVILTRSSDQKDIKSNWMYDLKLAPNDLKSER